MCYGPIAVLVAAAPATTSDAGRIGAPIGVTCGSESGAFANEARRLCEIILIYHCPRCCNDCQVQRSRCHTGCGNNIACINNCNRNYDCVRECS